MKHSIASVSLSGTLKEKMFAIAKAGYDGIELFENDLTVSDIRPAELRKMAADLGIEIVALQPFRDYEAMPQALHLKNLDRANYKLDLVEKLGSKKLFVCSNTSPHTINDMDCAAEQLYILAEKAAKQGIEIGYEALSWGKYVNTYLQSVEIVNRANHPNLGHILDNYHIGVIGTPLDDIYSIKGNKITIAQIADAPRFDMGPMYLGRHYRCFPGQGSYPVVEYVKAIMATGYDGYLSHEIFSDEFRASLLEPTALDGKRSLIWVEGIAKASTQEKPTLTGIEFIEFTTQTDQQNTLVGLLENLGFAETFKHKTKDVSLFQIENVTIVLNRQESDKTQNTVCAVGFLTKNKGNIENWANKLNYSWKESNAQNHELNIPAVEGLGEVLFYFVDETQKQNNFYETEFNWTNQIPKLNGITRIDHIGHTVNPEFFLSNTLFYRALLGLEIEETLDILDPNGIVNSRVAKSENKNIRISLSSTRNQGTSSERFIAKIGGAGIQQIALATTDIFKTAYSITNKALILSIPDNYYADLRSKSWLSEEILQQIQAVNILFDQNEDGAFFHFYLKEQNGIFIEIIQRNGHYDRYGEINAQLRLTAQARDRTINNE